MGQDKVVDNFLRHVALLLTRLNYQDVSKHGAKVANAYRLARKELKKINEKRNLLPKTSTSRRPREIQTEVSTHTDNGKRHQYSNGCQR